MIIIEYKHNIIHFNVQQNHVWIQNKAVKKGSKTKPSDVEEKIFFLFVVKLQNILFGFFVLVKYLQLVDSTVSENKIHSFSGLSQKQKKKKNRKSNTRITKCNKYMPPCFS